MFQRPMQVPVNARVSGSRVGQQGPQTPYGQSGFASTPIASCTAAGNCGPSGSITILPLDTTPYTTLTNITLPTGQVANTSTTAIGTLGEFYVTARPKCDVRVLAFYMPPSVGNQVTIAEILPGDMNGENVFASLRQNGRVPGEAFIDAAALLPILSFAAGPQCPVVVHGYTRGLQAATTLQGYFVVQVM